MSLFLKRTLFVWFGIATIAFAGVDQTDIMDLSIDNQTISLSTPIIKVDGVSYFPIRDILDSIDAKLIYLRRDNAYKLEFKKASPSRPRSIIFGQYTREFWIDGQQNNFKTAPITYSNRLYVPYDDFIKLPGISSSAAASFRSPTLPPPYQANKVILASSDTGEKPSLNLHRIPRLSPDRDVFISFYDNRYSLVSRYKQLDGILFVNLSDILIKEGYTLSESGSELAISKENRQVRLSFDTAKFTITQNGKTETRFGPHPVIKESGTTYIPLASFIMAFDYTIAWNGRERDIILLNPIDRVDVLKDSPGISLKILSRHPLFQTYPDKMSRGSGYYFDLEYTRLATKKTKFKVPHPLISDIKLRQLNETTTRVEILYKESLDFPTMKVMDYGGYVSFYTVIQELNQFTYNNHRIVRIKGANPFKPSVFASKSPAYIAVDIPNSISNLPQIIQSDDPHYRPIWTSQFKLDPPVTRIVLDLHPDDTYTTRYVDESTFELAIPIKQHAVITQPKPTQRNEWSKRIIFIDPGHGGIDPGGVSPHRDLEKTYALDVSKRLQKRLEDAGAFVIMARTTDSQNPSLQDRAFLANKNNADIMISVHINSFYESYANGSETYYYKPIDYPLAKFIHTEMVRSLGIKDNGLKKNRLYVLRYTRMPAALVEPLFITNPSELEKLKDPTTRQKIADGVFNGIQRYYDSL